MVTGKATPKLTGLDTVRGAIDIIEQYFEHGWTDGLPIVPPTEELVDSMIAASGRDAMEVLGVVPPRHGVATIEAIATNAVMAGCRPEYMPVVVAAVEALLDERFDVQGLQATSDPAAPLVIVSGPVVQQVGINHGIGLFGHGSRANATIGRAVRLVMVNIGGGHPDIGRQIDPGVSVQVLLLHRRGCRQSLDPGAYRVRLRTRGQLCDGLRRRCPTRQ